MQVDDICFGYPQHPLFVNFSATIGAGVTLVQGGDGRGKSTLLRLLAGELPAASGSLSLHGITLGEHPDMYRRQAFRADPQSDAFEAVTPMDYFATLRQTWPEFDDKNLPQLLDGFSLAPHLEKSLYMLSTGSKRKVWLAGAFAAGAALTLLDEPFAAIDKPSANFLLSLLAGAAQHPSRAWLLADYQPPADVPLAATIDLGD